MKKIEQENHQTEQVLSPEGEKDKYLQFGKFTRDCPQWILDKVVKIDNSEINQRYVEEVLRAIVDEFDSKKHQTTFTNNIKKSCFISVRDVLEKRQTSCGSLATVVASVFRNLKIPTKLVHGRYIENNPQMRHAWNEINFNGNDWVPFDITCLQNGFKLDEFHIKELEAVDWDEFEQDVEKLFQ